MSAISTVPQRSANKSHRETSNFGTTREKDYFYIGTTQAKDCRYSSSSFDYDLQPNTVGHVQRSFRNLNQRRMPAETYNCCRHNTKLMPSASLGSCYGVKIPANIRHRYGTNTCHELFDNDKIEQVAIPPTNHVATETRMSTPNSASRLNSSADVARPSHTYESMGLILRQNVIQGYGATYHRGVTQTDFTPTVHEQHSALVTDDHRCRKDHLSKWVEQDVIRGRMDKAWNDRKLTETKLPGKI